MGTPQVFSFQDNETDFHLFINGEFYLWINEFVGMLIEEINLND